MIPAHEILSAAKPETGDSMVYELDDPSKAKRVFADWEDPDTGILACLEKVMGKIFVTDPEEPGSALAVIGDFAFCAGEPDLELMRGKPDRWLLAVPQNEAWAALIEENFPANKRIRYAIRKKTEFDREKLAAMAGALPDGYSFRRFDGGLYDVCREDAFFRDCVTAFESKEQFLSLGRGFAVMKEGRLAAAASSYSRCLRGIDIEIKTVKGERHRGLASAAGAKLILECLGEGLYPFWDAANRMSVRLAEKFGYEFSREYPCFGIE